jgi:hypothetical protein
MAKGSIATTERQRDVTYSSNIVGPMTRPQTWQLSQAIRAQELDRILLTQPYREQCRRSFCTHFAQINSIAKHRPIVLDGAEVRVVRVGEITILLKLQADVVCEGSLVGEASFDVGGVVLLQIWVGDHENARGRRKHTQVPHSA